MKVKVKDIEGKLISIIPEIWHSEKYSIKMEHEGYELVIQNVDEDDITVIMDK